jgi:hypothetical protein
VRNIIWSDTETNENSGAIFDTYAVVGGKEKGAVKKKTATGFPFPVYKVG